MEIIIDIKKIKRKYNVIEFYILLHIHFTHTHTYFQSS